MESGNGNGGIDIDTRVKLNIKNIALKAPKKSKNNSEGSFWRVFWISNIPKRECVSDVRKEYCQVMENMQD
jgi:hypothetical protein